MKTLTEYERMLCYGEKARRFAEELATSDDIKIQTDKTLVVHTFAFGRIVTTV